MPVEFLGIAATADGTETTASSTAAFDRDYTLKLARAHEDHDWDRVLFAYGSGSPDPAPAAAFIASRLDRLQILLAHRPNVSYPTFAAKTFATLDRISDGSTTVHFITGGNDHEQQREGDFLTKDERYDRTREYIRIVKKAWTSREPFDHEGTHYRFHDFVSDVFPVQAPRPGVSFGGSSEAAYAAGGAEADIYCLWGEPLARTAEQIERVLEAAKQAGRADAPRIQVAFRPIIAPTEELAWEKAHRTVAAIKARREGGDLIRRGRPAYTGPENAGRSACWRSPRPVSATTGRCGRRPPPPPAGRATPTPWSAPRRRSPRRCWTTTTWAWTSSPPAATTWWTTRSTSAGTSSRSSARRSPSGTRPGRRPRRRRRPSGPGAPSTTGTS